MAQYKVQMASSSWYEVIVEADSKEQALAIGMDSLMDGGGYQVDDTFAWEDDTYVGEVE
jgi:hypothetical protein